jgi:class 3 adenylate cyclase
MIFAAALALAIWMYNNMVRANKINELQAKAQTERAIVQSLFPSNVRDRLIQDAESQVARNKSLKKAHKSMNDFPLNKPASMNLLTSEGIFGSKPIADFFSEVTVMFGDLAGFTAWSSARDPTQVFTLLEVIYHSFDSIAKKRKVFKLETVGDCYVAVAGLPEPRNDHAEAMVRFATDCLIKLNDVTSALAVTMGPGTAELDMRIGLHSGPVTAGVLRGDKGRFQLFGDTMNTADRIESTGALNKIHVSQEAADLLQKAGKGHWLTPREDRVNAKGKGELRTFWVNSSDQTASINNVKKLGLGFEKRPRQVEKVEDLKESKLDQDKKIQRLIDWNIDVFSRLLKLILARRQVAAAEHGGRKLLLLDLAPSKDGTVLDEVKAVIILPEFDASAFKEQVDPDSITLDPQVAEELADYVSTIAELYHNNPFHNFEHSSHVTMSVTKLLSRIVNPRETEITGGGAGEEAAHEKIAADLHDNTFGITSDPLTHFACVFSAMIHDVDHPGVPNSTLVGEHTTMAKLYKNQSVAEQNSVDVGWNLLTSG